MRVGIIDLGINNLTSVQRAFSVPLKSSDSLTIIEADSELERPNLIVLPGLGTFGSGITALRQKNLINRIKMWYSEGSKLVGICLGMQLLATQSQESPDSKGLNLIDSQVVRLPDDQNERIPHTGWAETNYATPMQPFPSLRSTADFYFVHSYHLIPVNKADILTTTPFGDTKFVSSILSNNILGIQFHPEKSGMIGKILISEIVQWARHED